MKQFEILFLASLLLLVWSCQSDANKGTANNDEKAVIYHGGDILTMEGEAPQYVESLVTQNGKIAFTGPFK